MTNRNPITVRELGEQGLLQLLQRFCPAQIVGDDAAVLPPKTGYEWVVTTDVLVDGVHFSDRTMPPEALGWRAAAVNLSDLAAMGAEPVGVTIGLGLPEQTRVEWVQSVYTGFSQCLEVWGGVILGGDVVRSPQPMISVTAIGEVLPENKILRTSAQPGDAIVVTGYHGGSRAGLELLLHPRWGQDLTAARQSELIQIHQRPAPRLDVVRLLQGQRCSGMDSSDGLADALLQICRASGVGATIIGDRIPLHPALLETQFLGPKESLDWGLYGGEDFELVLTMFQHEAASLCERLPAGAAIIGEVVSGSGVNLLCQGETLPLSLDQGFQHWSQ
ncbi:MAG: thiamine-phosphate kinase [Cyanobacteria bacterium P01_F01_bin.42]